MLVQLGVLAFGSVHLIPSALNAMEASKVILKNPKFQNPRANFEMFTWQPFCNAHIKLRQFILSQGLA